MHAPFEQAGINGLTHESILRLDRAMRRSRDRVLSAGPLNGPQWAVLVELSAAEDGMAFDALQSSGLRHFGKTMLLACISNLQETGLVEGLKQSGEPLHSHVRITRLGHERMREVLDGAVAILKRQA